MFISETTIRYAFIIGGEYSLMSKHASSIILYRVYYRDGFGYQGSETFLPVNVCTVSSSGCVSWVFWNLLWVLWAFWNSLCVIFKLCVLCCDNLNREKRDRYETKMSARRWKDTPQNVHWGRTAGWITVWHNLADTALPTLMLLPFSGEEINDSFKPTSCPCPTSLCMSLILSTSHIQTQTYTR